MKTLIRCTLSLLTICSFTGTHCIEKSSAQTQGAQLSGFESMANLQTLPETYPYGTDITSRQPENVQKSEDVVKVQWTNLGQDLKSSASKTFVDTENLLISPDDQMNIFHKNGKATFALRTPYVSTPIRLI